MSGGGGGGGSDAVDYQRQQEQERQARIRSGMTRIDEIFDGKKTTTRTPTGVAINPNVSGIGSGTYYGPDGAVYNLNNGNSGNLRWAGTSAPGVAGPGGRVQTNISGAWQDLPTQLYSGVDEKTTTEGGFGDDFYNARAKAYNDYALPQLQDQYTDQKKQLTYALARGGNLGSSLSASKNATLGKDYALQQQNVYDTGQDYANKARSDVAAQKQNMVSLLQASADPDAVANLAQSQAQNLSAMPSFTPLSPVISNVAGSLGTYLSNQQTADAIRKAYANDPYTNSLSRSSGKVG
jgi:hypothetical protein